MDNKLCLQSAIIYFKKIAFRPAEINGIENEPVHEIKYCLNSNKISKCDNVHII